MSSQVSEVQRDVTEMWQTLKGSENDNSRNLAVSHTMLSGFTSE